jgi:transcriptional regulator with XRE-family HTH domain
MPLLASNHKSCLSDIENGKMNVKVNALKRIADILEVDVKDFL